MNNPYRSPPADLKIGDMVEYIGLTWEEWHALPPEIKAIKTCSSNGKLFRERFGKIKSISRFTHRGFIEPAYEVRFPHTTRWQFFHKHDLVLVVN